MPTISQLPLSLIRVRRLGSLTTALPDLARGARSHGRRRNPPRTNSTSRPSFEVRREEKRASNPHNKARQLRQYLSQQGLAATATHDIGLKNGLPWPPAIEAGKSLRDSRSIVGQLRRDSLSVCMSTMKELRDRGEDDVNLYNIVVSFLFPIRRKYELINLLP